MEVFLVQPGRQRERVVLGPSISQGGAGAIHLVVGDPTRVVKLYNAETLKKEGKVYEEKIGVMLANPPRVAPPQKPVGSPIRGEIIQIAWPLAIARNKVARFVGFAMPAIEVQHTIELECVLQEKQAARFGLRHGLDAKLTLAHNLAVVAANVHAQGHAIVDLKPVNLKYYKHELFMAVLDCDGFYVKGALGGAPQVTPGYLAPEFINAPVTAPEQQDRFALAVILFKLLNFGIDPYSGVPQSSQIPAAISDRIHDQLYAYGVQPNANLLPMPASAHEALPADIRTLFDRAFGRVHAYRPSALEWVGALARYANQTTGLLEPCSAGHLCFKGMPCGKCQRDLFKQAAVKALPHTQTVRHSLPRQVGGVTPPSTQVAQPVANQTQASGGGGVWLIVALVIGVAGYFLFGGKDKPPAAAPLVANVAAALPPSSLPPPSVSTERVAAIALRPYYGLTFAENDADRRIYVGAVDMKGPAGDVGLVVGDLVLAIGDVTVNNRRDLDRAIASGNKAAGQAVTISVRGRSVNALIPTMLDEPAWEKKMAALRSLPLATAESSANANAKAEADEHRPPVIPLRAAFGMRVDIRDGVVTVVTVSAGGPVASGGVEPSDIILSIDGRTTRTSNELLSALDGIRQPQPVEFIVYRGGKTFKTQVAPVMISEKEWARQKNAP